VKRHVRLLAVLALLASACGGEGGSQVRQQQTDAVSGVQRRSIDTAVSVRRGSSRVIYPARGSSGQIGSFIGTCHPRRAPHTAYRPTRQAADAIVAIDGRGVSHATTVVFGDQISGGTRPNGLERWLVRMGREPEEVTIEAWLGVVRERGSPDCTFWLYGSVSVLRR
jgi:hypothetical protein